MSAKMVQRGKGETDRNATSGGLPNNVYRIREHLTEAEMDKLLTALKRNRYGHRDWLIGLVIYRHGLRVSEACDLRWDDIDLPTRTIMVRRLKGSTNSVHYLERDESGRVANCKVKGCLTHRMPCSGAKTNPSLSPYKILPLLSAPDTSCSPSCS